MDNLRSLVTSTIQEMLLAGESSSMESSAIDMNKLEQYAKAISIMCNGEYGDTYVIPKENKVFVCLGDSSPFDDEELIAYMRGAIAKDYDATDLIEIEVENECPPEGDGWYELTKKGWTPWKYE